MRPRVVAAVALLLAACSRAPGPAEHPVLLVGIDGLEPRIVDALVRAGRMPNLARIAHEGVLGELATLAPTKSPVIWTTVATGQGMAAHGIDDFASPEGVPYTSNCRRVPALWNIVSDHGLRVDVVGWWVSWPAEAVNGRVVSSYAAQSQFQIVWKGNLWEGMPEQTWPPSLANEIAPFVLRFRDVEALHAAFWSAFTRPVRDVRQHEIAGRAVQDLMWTLAGDRSFAAIGASFLAGSPRADLTLVYLGLPDVAGHRLWRYHAPGDFSYSIAPEDVRDFGDFLNQSYVEADRLLGELVASAPPGTNVLVVSDHGMHADPRYLALPDQPSSGHHDDAPPGIFAAAGPLVKPRGNLLGDPRARLVGDVLGVAPLVLRLLDVPVPGHWPRARSGTNPLEELVVDDWRRDHRPRLWPDGDADFRAATEPRRPPGDVDGAFIDALRDLGYLGAGADDVRRSGDLR